MLKEHQGAAVIDPPWGEGTKEIISPQGVHPSNTNIYTNTN